MFAMTADGEVAIFKRLMCELETTRRQNFCFDFYISLSIVVLLLLLLLLTAGFNLSAYKTVQLLEGVDQVIRCTCKVGNKLWVAVGGGCLILNMQTHEVEVSIDQSFLPLYQC